MSAMLISGESLVSKLSLLELININLCLSRGLFLGLVSIRPAAALSLPHSFSPCTSYWPFLIHRAPLVGTWWEEGQQNVHCERQHVTVAVPLWTETRRPRVWPWMRQVLFSALVSHLQNKRVAVGSLLPTVTFWFYSGAWLNGLVIGHIQCEGLNWDWGSAWLLATHILSPVPIGSSHLAGFLVTDHLCQSKASLEN